MGILGTAGSRKKTERKKKPDELLSSVVRETAIPAALELLRGNARFTFPSGTAWVMLVLGADSIGGLSKRDGRDEAKGSIIELIDSDQIQTVATGQMLDEEVFGIIPRQDTLARMEEYSLLSTAEYSWAVVWQKQPGGDLVVDMVSEATFVQAKSVAAGTLGLEEALGEAAWKEHSGVAGSSPAGGVSDETVAASASTDTEAIEAVEGAEGDEDPVFDDPADAAGPDDAGEEPVFEDSSDAPVFDDEPIDFDLDDDSAEQASEATEDPVFGAGTVFAEIDDEDAYAGDHDQEADDAGLLADQDEVRDVIARRFMSENLQLEVGLEEFNAIFAIGAPVVQIEVPQGATEWLGDQVAQLNRQANADLAQLRFAHEDELRTLFVNLSSKLVEETIRKVATDRDGSRYKALKEAAEAGHLERQGQKEQNVRETRSRIAKDYEAQAKRLAEQAAIQAEIQFKERNRAKMEREQADAVAEIDRVLENSHSHDMQEILRVRHSDATLQMQVGTTRIFEILGEKQKDYLDAEESRLAEWKAEIQRIVDDNRKADIAQAEALAEHQRTTDEVGILRREHDSLMESVRTEHADRTRRMEDELERNRKDAVQAMQARDAEWQHAIDIEKGKTDSQASRVADLLLQVETVEATIDGRYQKTIADLKSDRESYSNAMGRANAEHERSTKVIILLMVAIGLICGGAGWMFGFGMG